jgi:hypothetical protein
MYLLGIDLSIQHLEVLQSQVFVSLNEVIHLAIGSEGSCSVLVSLLVKTWNRHHHYGRLTFNYWDLGSREYMQSIGGKEWVKDPGFFMFDEPVTGYILYKDLRPYWP